MPPSSRVTGGGCTITWASKLTYVANVGDVRVTLDDGGTNYATKSVALPVLASMSDVVPELVE